MDTNNSEIFIDINNHILNLIVFYMVLFFDVEKDSRRCFNSFNKISQTLKVTNKLSKLFVYF